MRTESAGLEDLRLLYTMTVADRWTASVTITRKIRRVKRSRGWGIVGRHWPPEKDLSS